MSAEKYHSIFLHHMEAYFFFFYVRLFYCRALVSVWKKHLSSGEQSSQNLWTWTRYFTINLHHHTHNQRNSISLEEENFLILRLKMVNIF